MTRGSKTIDFLLVALLTFAIGFYMGGAGCGQPKDKGADKDTAKTAPEKAAKKVADKAKAAEEDRYKVPVGDKSYSKGPKNAPVTIVEFSEFQCPFCKRVEPTVDKIMEEYKDKVRVVFRHNPLPFHKDAGLASTAALAAGEQGKFWEMHKKLFDNQRQMKREDLEKYAQELGLDMAKFKDALDKNPYKAQIEEDQKVAQQFAARGTPHFFVNGIRVKGAQPFENFKKVIDEELENAKKFAGEGDIYAAVTKSAKTKADAPKPKERAEDTSIYKVSTGNGSAMKGDKDALITILEFSEFQCPFCKRVEPTVDKIMEEYKGKVRVFFRHNPLPFHKDAPGASLAALAAGKQGKFWEMHKKLFENQRRLQEEHLAEYAKELGLNVDKFKKDMADPALQKQIDADKAEAAKFGARGTPAFFINGRKITGAQPFENFKKLIDELLPVAEKVGKKGDDLYAELTKNGQDKAAAPERKPQEDPNKVYDVSVGSSVWKGGKNAPVTIIEFSEFQCPFCKRVVPTIHQILKEYGDKVKISFKHNPLPFHKDAQLASEAALAAGEQGKFWEMHDKIFENNKALKREDLEKYAQELGLDLNKFKKFLDSGAGKAQIESDKKDAAKVGARGTPTFFINGKKFVGAQPFENFKKKIDEELKAKK